MASLHAALKYLSPTKFSDLPSEQEDLDPHLADLFTHVQAIVESIPMPDPGPSQANLHTHATHPATSAAEMTISSARSPPPAPEHLALQKEWGKPIKLSAKENPMNMAVYKLGSKDGKGAWFARRSVHEGLGFSQFKRGFEREFPTSLAVQGAPGEGNIRGIGAETKVEDISVPNRGRIEVYRLSAQFPGPTTPRDFVTLLVTSSKAMKPHGDAHKSPDLAPRHYMIVSKPCDHPDTQPRAGFIRGQYESVEFIREIPRKLKASQSTTDLSKLAHLRPSSPNMDNDAALSTNSPTHDQQRTNKHLSVDTDKSSALRELSPSSRKRGATVGFPANSASHTDAAPHYDPEDNPVEWIMVTRSDPGGSVPRFMVERGTPSSICADAIKFLDWACQRDDDDEALDRPGTQRRESFASWQANGTLAGIREHEESLGSAIEESDNSEPTTPKANESKAEPFPDIEPDRPESAPHSPSSPSHILAAVSETLTAYTPQVVRDHIPYLHPHTNPPHEEPVSQVNGIRAASQLPLERSQPDRDDDDVSSIISATSYASADSHLPSSPSFSSKSLSQQTSESQILTQHNKELTKLAERKATMDAKIALQRDKINSQAKQDTEKEQAALKKAEEKHDRELKKSEEKYKKEVAKLEHKKAKESKKQEERKRKLADKDEKARLTRERDEARAQVELLKTEGEIFQRQIGELQRENTALTARLGKLELGASGNGGLSGISTPALLESPLSATRFRGLTFGEGRNRSSSTLTRLIKPKDRSDTLTSEGSSSQLSKGS
ncbi:hypothetical protein B0A52_06306 [Exophiala mesophila]|uniref:DUF3074 domain-containing protein n=1 Tax=Exophiala mesophila TaxID=212818 RepID=A0A438N3L8_EXOME|nr:hypothetical protein B0A52_06306 [Exophiala mesophila]